MKFIIIFFLVCAATCGFLFLDAWLCGIPEDPPPEDAWNQLKEEDLQVARHQALGAQWEGGHE